MNSATSSWTDSAAITNRSNASKTRALVLFVGVVIDDLGEVLGVHARTVVAPVETVNNESLVFATGGTSGQIADRVEIDKAKGRNANATMRASVIMENSFPAMPRYACDGSFTIQLLLIPPAGTVSLPSAFITAGKFQLNTRK